MMIKWEYKKAGEKFQEIERLWDFKRKKKKKENEKERDNGEGGDSKMGRGEKRGVINI